jgi:hypothetical protein
MNFNCSAKGRRAKWPSCLIGTGSRNFPCGLSRDALVFSWPFDLSRSMVHFFQQGTLADGNLGMAGR